jgi:hypothetical protein
VSSGRYAILVALLGFSTSGFHRLCTTNSQDQQAVRLSVGNHGSIGDSTTTHKNSVAAFLDKRKCSAFDRSTTGPDAFDRAIPLAAYRGNGHVKSFHAGIRTAKYSF